MKPTGMLTLLLLLLILQSPTTAAKVSFLKLSRRLTRLRGPQICNIRRARAIETFERQLQDARECLPTAKRRRLRTRCRTRPATPQSEAACRRLRSCPRPAPIKKAIRDAQRSKCPPVAPRLPRVEKRWRARLNRRIRRAGLPKPVYDTIMLEPRRKKADSAVVLLHGITELAAVRLPLAEMIRDALPGTRIILPQAPVQFNDFLNFTRPSWFNIFGNTVDAPQAVDEIFAAAKRVSAVADVQAGVYGIPRKRVAIVGISQGGAVAITTYLRDKWAAAVGISTFLPLANSYPEALGKGSEDVELLMVHGRTDQIIPFSLGELSRDLIRSFGRMVRFVELKGDHFLDFEQDEVNAELMKQLKAALV